MFTPTNQLSGMTVHNMVTAQSGIWTSILSITNSLLLLSKLPGTTHKYSRICPNGHLPLMASVVRCQSVSYPLEHIPYKNNLFKWPIVMSVWPLKTDLTVVWILKEMLLGRCSSSTTCDQPGHRTSTSRRPALHHMQPRLERHGR
jgi:hypothetical protein